MQNATKVVHTISHASTVSNRMVGGVKPQAGVTGVAVEMYILSDLWCFPIYQ